MAIVLSFTRSTGSSVSNKGTSIPNWFQNEDDYSKWYYGSEPFEYNFFYNMVDTENSMFIQYGTNMQGWGSGRFFVQELEILNEVPQANGSIDVTVRSRLRRFNQRPTETIGASLNVEYTFKIMGVTVLDLEVKTGDTISNNTPTNWITETYNVKPQEYENGTGIELFIHYPNGEFNNQNITLGYSLFNDNPLTYVPMAIRKTNVWKDLDSNNGKIKRRINNVWVDKSDENMNTSKKENTGKNRLRVNGVNRQLPKMTGGIVQ